MYLVRNLQDFGSYANRSMRGFENMSARTEHVEDCIKEVQEIYEAVESLACTQEQAVLDMLSFESSSSSESSGEEIDCSLSQYDSFASHDIQIPNDSVLTTILHESDYDWFQFVESVEDMIENISYQDNSSILNNFFLQLLHLGFNERQLEPVVQSHCAFEAATSASYREQRMARSVNGEVVSESDSEDSDQYIGVKSVTSEAGKALVRKK